MLIYLMVFAVSFGLTLWGMRLEKKENKKGFWVCMVLAVLLIAGLAGLRDETVGTDSLPYWNWVAKAMQASDLQGVMAEGRLTEPAFTLLLYVAAKWLKDFHWLYFMNALCAYGFCMATLVRFRKVLSLPFAWISYLLLFYSNSLNQMRQATAMTMILLAFSYLMEKKYLPYAALTVFACLFHNSAIVSVFFLALYLVLKKWDTIWTKGLVVGGAAAGVLLWKPLFLFLNQIGIVQDRFMGYVNRAEFSNLSLNPVIVRLPFTLLVLVFYGEFVKEKSSERLEFRKPEADFLLVMMLLEMVISELRVFSVDLYRICLYFGVFRCLGIGRLVAALKESPEHRKWAKPVMAALLAMLVVIWLYQVVLQGNDEIYPYTSELLHISAETFF